MRLMFIIVWWSERKVILEEREKVKGKAVLVTLFSSPLFFFWIIQLLLHMGRGQVMPLRYKALGSFPTSCACSELCFLTISST